MSEKPSGWLYKIRNSARERATCFLSSDKPINFSSLRRRFDETFCTDDCKEAMNPFQRMAAIRHTLWTERKNHLLNTDPLLDELCVVFADWVAKQKGARLLFPDEMTINFHGDANLSEYVFDLV